MKTINYSSILFLILITEIFYSCTNQNDWNRFGLNGKVKTYSEKYYDVEKRFGEWETADNEYFSQNKVIFDENGNYQWIEYLYSDDELFGKLKPTYENGKVVEEIYYDEDGELISKTKITYISKNDLEFISYNVEGKITTEGKSNFEKNKVINQTYKIYEDDKITNEYTVIFEYNQDGNLISQRQTDKKGEIFFKKFEYLSFDKNKNWLKRLDYKSDKSEPENIVIREIEYY
jgi:hypothetical protein